MPHTLTTHRNAAYLNLSLIHGHLLRLHCSHLLNTLYIYIGTPTNAVSLHHYTTTLSRARAERESRLKALRERARKGLLSEGEKVILAAEEAEAARAKDDGCIIA